MESILELLPEEEQKQVDPHLFTCCPHCKRDFKIPAHQQVVRDGWVLEKQTTHYQGKQLAISIPQSALLYELARSHICLSLESVGMRISNASSEDFVGIAAVQLCRLRKFLLNQNIPCPVKTVRSKGYIWKIVK